MICAVTGGSGFIGARLVARLRADGHEVRLLSRRPSPGDPQVIAGDLASDGNPEALTAFIRGADIVYHCAGEVQRESAMRALHVDGTRRLLAAAGAESDRRAAPLHWVQLSSVGAYGPPAHPTAVRVVTEDTPCRPFGEYEVTKAEADVLVQAAGAKGMVTYTILRPSNVFGPGMTNGSLRALGRMVRRGLFFYVGAPGAIATYVHVEDVVETLIRCGSDARARGGVLNLSNDCPLSALIDGIADAVGARRPRLRVPEFVVRAAVLALGGRGGLTTGRVNALVARTSYPTTRVEKLLGFTPQHAAPSAIRDVVAAS